MNVNLRTTLTRSTLVVELSHDPRWPGAFMDMVARSHADREAHRSGYVDAGMPIRTELVHTHGGSHRTRWVHLLPAPPCTPSERPPDGLEPSPLPQAPTRWLNLK